ncbi:hypothetical protein [Streptomyces sp. V1I1]|uniref:hypothetical protein n=1 Tax=Streptomyces sp. V1I1 TaxID=3042272 RepID=UPI00277FF805|nr:hypothetical protein [Streptomyces sp. V1I1]MDQ0941819.1 hypothetical protein [Streptomyces sp. V1I1]
MPTYHEIMTTDLSTLTTAAGRWDGMAKEFHKQEIAYKRDVHGISMGQTWTGLSADAANRRFAITLKEFQNAQVEVKAVASLLRDAHAQFTDLRKKLESARADAVVAGMAVSDEGVVSYDTAKLSDGERTALHHDLDYQQSVRTAIASWQKRIDRLVKDVGEADTGVEIALKAVVIDSNIKDGTLNGFNGQAQGDIEKYEAAAAKKDARTKTDGWVSEGEAEASGPGVGTSATGPDAAAGKLAEAEAHADLGRASAEGSLTNGPMKLAGEAEAYVGAKASAAGGITNEGVKGEAAAFAGAEASAKGTADAGPVGVYGRAETKAGAEAGINAGAGLEGLQAGAEAFAGAKAGVAGGADIGGIGAGATAEGWAGIGAEAEATFGKGTDGKWHIGAKTGVAVGLGGEVGFEVTVDPGKIADTASDAADAVGDAAGAVGDAIGSVF